jgi:hypothetical protein
MVLPPRRHFQGDGVYRHGCIRLQALKVGWSIAGRASRFAVEFRVCGSVVNWSTTANWDIAAFKEEYVRSRRPNY